MKKSFYRVSWIFNFAVLGGNQRRVLDAVGRLYWNAVTPTQCSFSCTELKSVYYISTKLQSSTYKHSVFSKLN